MATTTSPSPRRLWWRGLTRRCPVCGQGHLFRRWFTMIERCPRCGLRFERTEGHWTGDLGINTIVSFGALLIVLLGGFLISYPDTSAAALLAASAVTAVVAPIAFFPFSKTIWLAIDLQLRPPEDDEVSEPYRWGPTRA
jgi:uncharacterized protein (DUF983 family)